MAPPSPDRRFQAFLRHRRPADLIAVVDAAVPAMLLAAHRPGDGESESRAAVVAAFERAVAVAESGHPRPVVDWLVGLASAARDGTEQPDTAAARSAAADLASLDAAIAQLPEPYAVVLRRRLRPGATPVSIAADLGTEESVVASRLAHGLERLRARLPARYGVLLTLFASGGPTLHLLRHAVTAAVGVGGAVVTGTAAVGGGGALAAALKWLGITAVGGAAVWGVTEVVGRDDAPTTIERVDVVDVAPDVDGPPVERTPVPGSIEVAAEEAAFVPPPRVKSSLSGTWRDQRGGVSGVVVDLLRFHGDALVAAAAPLPEPLGEVGLLAGSAVTDQRGDWAIEGIEPGGTWLLQVSPPGRPAFLEPVNQRRAPGASVELGVRWLPYPGTAEGRVIDPRVLPLEGARIRRVPRAWRPPSAAGDIGLALAACLDTTWSPGALVATIDDGHVNVLEPPAWFVELHARLSPEPGFTDSRGRFAWQAYDAEPFDAILDAPGFVPRSISVVVDQTPNELGEFTLEPFRQVAFVVRDVQGHPVAAAEVFAAPWVADRPATVLQPFGATDADGELAAPFFDNRPLWVAVRPAPGEPCFATRVPAGTLHRIDLPARFPLIVDYRSWIGDTPDAARLQLIPGWPRDDGAPGVLALHQLGALPALPLPEHEAADDERPGRLVLDAVPSGRWTVQLFADGRVPAVLRLDHTGPSELRVDLREDDSLAVRTVDRRAGPLPGVPLVGADRITGWPALLATTGAEAIGHIARAPWSAVHVAVGASAAGWQPAVLGAGLEETDVVVDRLATLGGVVRPSARVPAPFRVQLTPLDDRLVWIPPVTLTVPRDVDFVVEGIEPGNWEVAVRTNAGPLQDVADVLELLAPTVEPLLTVPLQLVAGERRTAVFDPAPAGPAPEPEPESTLRGRFTVDGRRFEGDLLLIRTGAPRMVLAVDAEGRFDTGLSQSGVVHLLARDLDGLEFWKTLFEVSTDPEPLDIALQTSLLSAQLVPTSRARVADARAILEGTTGGDVTGYVRRVTTSTGSGMVAVDRLPHGIYDLWVMHPDHGFVHDDSFEVGGVRGTSGMSLEMRGLLRCGGRVDEDALGVAVPRTSQVVLVREPDEFDIAQTRVGVVDAQGGFRVEGLLPGRYAVELRCAVRVPGRGGGFLLVAPEHTNVRVNCPPIEIGEVDRAGVVLDRRR